MDVLVIGGTGFVGRRLVPELIDDHDVVCVSKSRTSPHCETIHADLSNPDLVERLPESVDVIVHLAAYVPDNQREADPLRCDAVNSRGVLQLLEYANDVGVEQFVYLSSCHYLESEIVDGQVEYTVAPDDVYESSKYAGEVLCGVYRDAFGVETITLRSAYIYGPGMHRNTALYSFVRSAIEGETITLYNGGLDATDFVYVDDVVRAIELALDGPPGEYVVGSQERSTMKDLAETVLEVVNGGGRLEVEEQTRTPVDFFVHSDNIEDRFGYLPRYMLQDGIFAMIDDSSELTPEGAP